MPKRTATPAQLTNPADIDGFMFAGNATFTLRSQRTGKHITYRVQAKANVVGDVECYFVSVMTGSDNENSYTYLGRFDQRRTYWPDRRWRIAETDERRRAFDWFLRHKSHPALEVWHEGRCGCCGRKLTTPESIQRGIGPVCAAA